MDQMKSRHIPCTWKPRGQGELYLYQKKIDFKPITISRGKHGHYNDKGVSLLRRKNNHEHIHTQH